MSDAQIKPYVERMERQIALAKQRDGIEAELVHEMGLPLMWTYMIEAGELVKIGRAKDVGSRVKALQTGSAELLRVIRRIPFDCERQLHLRFAAQRAHGEWFRFHFDMLTESYGDWLLSAAKARLAEAA